MNNKVDKNENAIVKEAKDWPKDNKMANFGEDISDPVREALQVALDRGDKVYEEGIPWNGLKQGHQPIFHPPLALHAQTLKYCKESHGRDVFTEIISVAIQLGMEQGRREIITELKELSFMFTSQTGKDILKKIIK